MTSGALFWLLSVLAGMLIHFSAYALLLRRLFAGERAVVLYHVLPGMALLMFLTAKGMGPTQVVGAAALYGVYSLTFLGLWASSDGGYSLRILAHIDKAGRAGTKPDLSDMRKLGDHKKRDRVHSLKRLGLVRTRGGSLGLTVKGRSAAACLALLRRLTPKRNALHKFVLVGVPVGVLVFLQSTSALGISHGLAYAFLYAFICEVYMFFVALLPHSVSFWILSALRKKDASQEEIDRSLTGETMVRERLEGLSQGGFLRKGPDGCMITAKGRRLASFFDKARRFFGHAGSPEWAARSSSRRS